MLKISKVKLIVAVRARREEDRKKLAEFRANRKALDTQYKVDVLKALNAATDAVRAARSTKAVGKVVGHITVYHWGNTKLKFPSQPQPPVTRDPEYADVLKKLAAVQGDSIALRENHPYLKYLL